MTMIMHCGGEMATRDQVMLMAAPEHTKSWAPVSYGDAINQTLETIELQLRLPVAREEYALNKTGNQMFALFSIDTGDDESRLSIALRQSYDKSLSLGVVAGSSVLVCDNLCFNGDAFKIMRKNTTNVWEDFKSLIQTQVACSLDAHASMQVDIEALKSVPCNIRRGQAYLGVLQGEQILTSGQAKVAHEDWKNPRHEEFAQSNFWGLYNAVTEGLKKGATGRVIDRHVNVHGWFRNELGF